MQPAVILLRQTELPSTSEKALEALLSAKERDAILKISDENRRLLKLHTHARLHREAALRLHVRPEELEYQTGEHGKPFFAGGGLHFSMSYTKDASVLALSDRPLGIDIEKIRPHRMRFRKNIGTAHELSRLQAAPDDLCLFYTFWTRKEAWLKYTGSGLTVPLSSFDVWEGPEAERLRTFHEEGYCISLCM